MVVKHPRGEHAHGVAAVRGGFRLGFVHELPVFFFANNVAWALLSFPVLFCFCPILPVFVAYPVWWVQEYTEEFREIAPRSKKNLGGVADGNITLINQRSVCDDLPVCNTYPHPPLIEASQTIIICAMIFYLPYFTDNLQNDFVFLSSFTNLCIKSVAVTSISLTWCLLRSTTWSRQRQQRTEVRSLPRLFTIQDMLRSRKGKTFDDLWRGDGDNTRDRDAFRQHTQNRTQTHFLIDQRERLAGHRV